MSLILSSPPSPQAQIESLQRELQQSNQRVRDLEIALTAERSKTVIMDRGMRELRRSLSPLFNALKQVFGELDAAGVSSAPSEPASGLDPRVTAAWNNWKQKLGGLPARFIDALMLQPSGMTQAQLRIAVGCAAGSVAGVVCALNKAGLINKANGKITLKEL